MISITQEPYGLQPVNSSHIWTIYDDEYTGYTNYKYVVDFYIDPYEQGHEKIGRIKLRPNSSGRASFDARGIIWNYIDPNPRVNSGVSANYDYVDIVNAFQNNGFTFTNYLNDNADFEKLRHIANYRILIGKEYTSGGTTTISIPTDYYTPNYPKYFVYSTQPVAYPGQPNTISSIEMNGWGRYVSDWAIANQTWESGYTFTHTTAGGTFVDGASSLSGSFSYTPTNEPGLGDILWVYSNQDGCGAWFSWADFETSGWNYRGTYSREYGFEGCYDDHSDFKTIWLGAAPNLMTDFESSLYQTLNPTTADRFKLVGAGDLGIVDLQPYQYGYENRDWDTQYGQFLNIFGGKQKKLNFTGLDQLPNYNGEGYVYTRKHHYDCPIIVSWLSGKNGAYQNTADFLITLSGTGNNIAPLEQLTPLSDGTGTFTPANELIQSYIPQYSLQNFTDWFGVMLSNGTPYFDSFADGRSMILLYELYGQECIEDPVHFLFINRNGAFDTYTFGQKNIRSHTTSISTYAQNGITDTSLQKWGSNMYRNVPYDQTTTTSVEAQSTFVDENDVPIIQDLFMSPYVWRIQPFKDNTMDADFYLVPIQITSNSVEEYKNRYNKLYQYDMTFTYNPIRQFNNPL